MQSWKDSPDSQRFADGRIAEGPVAASEVQGYVYDAKLRCAELARVVLADVPLAERLEREAAELRERFDRAFWVSARRLLRARPGRPQAGGRQPLLQHGPSAVERDRAGGARADVARTLLDRRSGPGWGVRTMSAEDEAYRPLAYHNGTVWPHDNSLIAHGLALRGSSDASLHILRSMLEASRFFDGGLPEVFAGLARRDTPFPVAYPTASRRRPGRQARPCCCCASCSASSPIRSSACWRCAPSGCPTGPAT